jgi:hypothetical protein
MALACTNPFGTMTAPMHVRGVALGANCEEGFQAVFCSLSSIQSGAMAKQIIGFQLKTTNIAGSSSLVQLPFSPKTAVFHKQLPAGSKSEFECKIGKPRVIQ